MKKRFYFCLRQMKWIYDAPKEETEESMKLRAIIAITRYIMENPDKIQIITKEKYES